MTNKHDIAKKFHSINDWLQCINVVKLLSLDLLQLSRANLNLIRGRLVIEEWSGEAIRTSDHRSFELLLRIRNIDAENWKCTLYICQVLQHCTHFSQYTVTMGNV